VRNIFLFLLILITFLSVSKASAIIPKSEQFGITCAFKSEDYPKEFSSKRPPFITREECKSVNWAKGKVIEITPKNYAILSMDFWFPRTKAKTKLEGFRNIKKNIEDEFIKYNIDLKHLENAISSTSTYAVFDEELKTKDNKIKLAKKTPKPEKYTKQIQSYPFFEIEKKDNTLKPAKKIAKKTTETKKNISSATVQLCLQIGDTGSFQNVLN